MEIKCPNCGAGIDGDGKYCKYCGNKLPDDTEQKRIEINDIAQVEMAKLERERFEMIKAEKEKRQKVKRIKHVLMVCIWLAVVSGFFILDMSWLGKVYYIIGGLLVFFLSLGLA